MTAHIELYDYAEWDLPRVEEDPVCQQCWAPATCESADGDPMCTHCAEEAEDIARGWQPQ